MKDETKNLKPAGYLPHMGEVRTVCGVLTADNDPSGSLNLRKRDEEIAALVRKMKGGK